MATQTKENDSRDSLNEHLKDIQRGYAWLSKNTGIPYGSIYSTLKHKIMEFSVERWKLINDLLGTDFK